MAPDLAAALKAGWAIVHFVTVSLPGHTIRWTDAGFARWGSGVWRARDPIFGTLHEISDITDGIDDDASPVTLTITPPSMAALEAMASADAQGGWVVIHLAAIDPATGTLATPYQLHMGELDQPRLAAGKVRRLEYDIITGDARGLQPNEEQRQSDAFRQLIWPGERGDEFATDGTKLVYWREDEPRNAVGLLSGRGGGKKDDNKAIEFSYEPNAPLAFPFGRVGVGGSLRYRVGYGPTNRWQSVVATVGASGPVKGLVSASFDDEVTFFDANNRATNGSHRGEMWFSFLPGAQPSPALTAPTGPNADGGPAGLWSPAHKLSGRPCFMWTGKENSKKSEYRGGLVKPVLTIDGLYGYDPLLDSTRGGGGTCRIDNPTTWPWLNEGARVALNWAIGRWEGRAASGLYGVPYQSWAVGGIAAPIQTIDVQAFAHAARIADANNWKVAAVPRSDEDKVDVLNDLLKASGAVRSRRCGMISCVSFGAPTPSVLTATEADTIAAPQVSLAPSRLDRRNTGIPSFLSAQHRWELTPIAAVTAPDWFEEVGGRHTEGYSYRYVPAAKQAAQLCYLDMATEREKVEAEVAFKPWMMALEPGMGFDWAAREYGLDGTKVRVWRRTWSPRSCSVKIKFREETDAKYAKAFAQTGEAPPAFAPPLPPVVSVPVNRPIWTSDPYPVTGSPGTIQVAPHEAMMPWGEIVSIAGAIISGLDGTKIYGVFWRPADSDGQGGGVEVEAYPASSHMADGSWIFLGWQAPANELGEFPPLPVAPPGHGGIGEAPGLPIAGDTTHLKGEPVQDVLDRLTDTKTLADQTSAEVQSIRDMYGSTADAATSAAKSAAHEAGANQAKAEAILAAEASDRRAEAADEAKLEAQQARAGAVSARNDSVAAAGASGDAAAIAAEERRLAAEARNQAQAEAQAAVGARNQASSFADAAGVGAAASQEASLKATAAAITTIPDAIAADLWTDVGSSGAPADRPSLAPQRVVNGAFVAPTGGILNAGPKQRVRWVQGKVIEIRLRAEVPAATPAASTRIGVTRFDANHVNLNSNSWMAITAVAAGGSKEVAYRIGCGVAVTGGSTINPAPGLEWLSIGCTPNLNAAGSAGEPGAQMRITAFSVRDITEEVNAARSADASASSAASAAASDGAAGQKAAAAHQDMLAAQTARGGAESAEIRAVEARDDAQGHASTAASQAGLSAEYRDQSQTAAQASNEAAGIATTKADQAGASAQAANADKLAAQAARDMADQKAQASVTAAARAEAFAGDAGDWAAASEGSALQAEARAGEGLAYRNAAVDARDEAVAARQGAGVNASTAQVAKVSTFPTRLDGDGSNFTTGANGSAETAASLPASRYENVPGFGLVGTASDGAVIYHRAPKAFSTGRVYRARVRVELVAAAAQNVRVFIRGTDGDYVTVSNSPTSAWVSVTPGVVTELSLTYGNPTPSGGSSISANTAWVRAGAQSQGAAPGGGKLRVYEIHHEDVTESVSAANAAASALTQSASASAAASEARLAANLAASVSSRSGNLLSTTDFASTAGWSANVPLEINAGPAVYHPLGERVLTVRHATAQVDVYSSRASVEEGKWYEVSAYLLAHRSQVKLFIRWINAAGAYITSPETAWTTTGGGGDSALADYTRLWRKAQAPAGAVAAVLMARKSATQSGSDSWMWMARPMLAETSETATGPALYTVGSGRDVLPAVEAQLAIVADVAASADGTAKAIHGVVMDVNGYVSGYGSVNDGVTSAFEVLAANFGIRDPGSGERTEYRDGIWDIYSPAENTRTRYGKAFGGAQKLVWWTGPQSVAEGSETKTNAFVYISQNTVDGPRFGGSDVVGGGKTSGVRTFSSGPGGSSVETTISGVQAGSQIGVHIGVNGGSLSTNSNSNGSVRLYETAGGNTRLLFSEAVVTVPNGLQNPDGSWGIQEEPSAFGTVMGQLSGDVTYRAEYSRSSGSTYELGAVIIASVTITPPL